VAAVGDHERNYYLWGAMGGAAMVGLGLAMSRPNDTILVVTGDGEMMMGVGSFATISVLAPANLTIAVVDNGHFGETGMQLSHSGHGIHLDKIAASMNVPWTARITDGDGVLDLRARIHARTALSVATIQVATQEEPRVMPSRDGVHIKNRVKQALGQAV
jgi:thiamine pyrophosphate-dependent acetolactate synthase large subunit-like protein